MQSVIQCEYDRSVGAKEFSIGGVYLDNSNTWLTLASVGALCITQIVHGLGDTIHHISTAPRTGRHSGPGITQTNWISHLVMHNCIRRQSQALIEAASWSLRGKRCRPYQVEMGLYKEPEWYINIAVDEV